MTNFIVCVFAYVIEGAGFFDQDEEQSITAEHLVLFEKHGAIRITAAAEGVRFLLISGKPIGEPVAWYGPIVMNTEGELKLAFEEYRSGSFIKHK